MAKQRRFVIFEDGDGYPVRGVTAVKQMVKSAIESAYSPVELVVYEGEVGGPLTLVTSEFVKEV